MAGDLIFVDRIAGAGEPAANELAHPLLQVREAVEAETIREAHDGRGIDVELRRHLVDGGERHRLRVLDDVFGDALLRLRQPVIAPPQLLDDVAGPAPDVVLALRFAIWLPLLDAHTPVGMFATKFVAVNEGGKVPGSQPKPLTRKLAGKVSFHQGDARLRGLCA